MGGCTELDFVKFKVNGMPTYWKVLNLCMLLVPKVYLWLLVTDIGMTFLMETAGILDMIINAVALGFILSVDETICSLSSGVTKYMVEHLEPYPLFDIADEEDDTEKDAYEKHLADMQYSCISFFQDLSWLIPERPHSKRLWCEGKG